MPEVVAASCVALAGFWEWMLVLMLTSFERSHLSAQISELGKVFLFQKLMRKRNRGKESPWAAF
jgi:hypothetical protein